MTSNRVKLDMFIGVSQPLEEFMRDSSMISWCFSSSKIYEIATFGSS